MQTFLPYPDFRTSLDCLDNKRLGKQRVEAMQLVNAIEKHTLLPSAKTAWFYHPACQQWVGHLNALKLYHDIAIRVWTDRGFKNTMSLYDANYDTTFPAWLGDPSFHAAHRSNLLRKDPIHYGQFGWTEPNDLPYVWPSKTKELETTQ